MNALTTRTPPVSLAPRTFEEAMRFAELAANSSLVPAAYHGKPADILLAVQLGAELGLSPMQALQNVAVINGRPSIWGDAMLAIVRGSPLCEDVIERAEGEGDAMVAICIAKRRGASPVEARFGVADAKRAGLWGKPGPWQTYPKRMLQLRARGFALRDAFPDLLRGLITAEEAIDTPRQPLPPARGEIISHEASAPNAAPLPSEAWPVINPLTGEVMTCAPRAWVKWVQRAVERLEDRRALAAWTREMQPHFDTVAATGEVGAAAVAEAQEAIVDREERLAVAEENAA